MQRWPLLVSLGLAGLAHAGAERPDDDLLNLSLEELLNVKVTVAARRAEPWLSAAGTVYVIKREDIVRYGWRDMKEILQSVPNMDFFYQGAWLPGGQRGFTGNMSSTLLLIDGREVQNLLANEAMINNNFPAERIERVEVLQGANSTLYGANAAQGVINIITRHGQTDAPPVTEIGVRIGEVDTRELTFLRRDQWRDLQYGISGSYFRSDLNYPEIARFVADTERYSRNPALDRVRDRDPSHFRNDENSWTLDGILRWRGAYAGFNLTGVENLSGLEKVKPDYNGVVARRAYANWFAGYEWSPSERWHGSVEASQFRERKEADRQRILNLATATSYDDLQIVVQQEDITPSFRWRLRSQLSYRPNDATEWTAGYDGWNQNMGSRVVYSLDSTGQRVATVTNGWPTDKETSTQQALYAQYAHQWNLPDNWGDSLKLTGGIRYHHQDFTSSAWLPRLSLVYQPDRLSAWKLTYGKAFRPPTIFEFEGVVTDQLASQKMTMLELNYSRQWQAGEWLLSSSNAIYRMDARNFYEKVFNNTLQVWQTLVNGEQQVKGIEAQLTGTRGTWQFQLGARYVDPDKETVAGQSAVLDVPRTKFKLGVAHDFSPHWHTSIFVDSWAKTFTRAVQVNGTGNELFRIPGWAILNWNLRAGPWKLGPGSEIEFGTYIENLFDKTYTQSNARGTSPVQFLQAPRNIRFNVTVRF